MSSPRNTTPSQAALARYVECPLQAFTENSNSQTRSLPPDLSARSSRQVVLVSEGKHSAREAHSTLWAYPSLVPVRGGVQDPGVGAGKGNDNKWGNVGDEDAWLKECLYDRRHRDLVYRSRPGALSLALPFACIRSESMPTCPTARICLGYRRQY